MEPFEWKYKEPASGGMDFSDECKKAFAAGGSCAAISDTVRIASFLFELRRSFSIQPLPEVGLSAWTLECTKFSGAGTRGTIGIGTEHAALQQLMSSSLIFISSSSLLPFQSLTHYVFLALTLVCTPAYDNNTWGVHFDGKSKIGAECGGTIALCGCSSDYSMSFPFNSAGSYGDAAHKVVSLEKAFSNCDPSGLTYRVKLFC